MENLKLERVYSLSIDETRACNGGLYKADSAKVWADFFVTNFTQLKNWIYEIGREKQIWGDA